MDWLRSLQMHEILIYGLVICIPIVAIASQAIVAIVKAVLRHRERMAMIDQGLNPDWIPGQREPEEPPNPGEMDDTQPYLPPR